MFWRGWFLLYPALPKIRLQINSDFGFIQTHFKSIQIIFFKSHFLLNSELQKSGFAGQTFSKYLEQNKSNWKKHSDFYHPIINKSTTVAV